MLTDGRTTDDGVIGILLVYYIIGILLAHIRAFGSDELTKGDRRVDK